MHHRLKPLLVDIALAASLLAPVAAKAAALIGHSLEMSIPAVTTEDMQSAFRPPETIPFPEDNLFTPEKLRLGRTLFFDPRLSKASAQSCSSCHNPAFAYGDGLDKAVGNGMVPLLRRSPTLINIAWSDGLNWDGRADTLEAQAFGPIESATEMAVPISAVVERLRSIDGYRAQFAVAFPNQPIDGETITRALATFERTIVSSGSPFDRWIAGEGTAIPEEAKRGFAVFTGSARCVACHAGWNFTDNGFHDIGLPDDDLGRGVMVPQVAKMRHAFKTPSLRNVELRAPYMHDGSLPTLKAVIGHYDAGGISRGSRSELVAPLGLTEREKSDLVAFLRTLSTPMPAVAIPLLPR